MKESGEEKTELRQLFRAVFCLSQIKRQVSVFDHVLDLSSHGHHEKNDEVDNEDRPKDWNVKHRKQGAKEGDYGGHRCLQPESKLRQPSNKWLEILVVLVHLPCAGLDRVVLDVLLNGWIDLWGQES